MRTSWRELLANACEINDETLNDIIAVYPENSPIIPEDSEIDRWDWKHHRDQIPQKVIDSWPTQNILDITFDSGYGGTEGEPFTAWSEKWVYFPICYDGSEWVGSAPRNPTDYATDHMGGG